MILKILLLATCGILSVLAVGGKTGAKEGYKISPSGLDALRHVRSTYYGKNTPYPMVARTCGRNLESFCLPTVVCFDPIGQMGTSCWCTQCNSEPKRDTNIDSWYHRTFRLYVGCSVLGRGAEPPQFWGLLIWLEPGISHVTWVHYDATMCLACFVCSILPVLHFLRFDLCVL